LLLPSSYYDTHELSTSTVCLDYFFSATHTLTDSDGSLSRCLGNPTHPAHPESAHPELVLPRLVLLILSLPILSLPILALLALALSILALPILALPALALPVLALPVLALPKPAHLKVEPVQPESAHAKPAHPERDPLRCAHPDRAQRDGAQPECAQPSDPLTPSAHNHLLSSVDIPGVRRFSKTCMTPLAGLSDGQFIQRTVASSYESRGQPVRGEFYSSHS
jgi:hypothetical protein